MKYFEDLTCVCLVSVIISVSLRHTVPTWLCIEFYKLSMKPSWTLCTLFIDALWLWSCWLCSQCCWCFLSGRMRLIILSHILFLSSFHIVFFVSVVLLCCDKPIWCQQCFYLFYFSCNKKVFSCSIFLDSTFYNVSPLWKNNFLSTEAVEGKTAEVFWQLFFFYHTMKYIDMKKAQLFGRCTYIRICTVDLQMHLNYTTHKKVR